MDKGTQLDLSSDGAVANPSTISHAKPFLGVHFTCCDVYARIYPNQEWSAYVGHCPRCARRIRIPIGPGGTKSRFFKAE